MKNLKIFPIVVLTLIAFTGNGFAQAAGILTYIEGRVDKKTKDSQGYLPLVVGENISVGDAIRTKSYSKAEITFKDGSVVRIADNSQIRVKEYEVDEFGMREKGVIHLDRGKMRAIVEKAKDKTPFDITTENSAGRVKGSDIFVAYEKSATSILVAEGILNTINPAFPDQIIRIREGSASAVPFDAPPNAPRKYLDEEKNRYESVTSPTIRKMETVIKDAETTRAVIVKLGGGVRVQPQGSPAWHTPVLNEVLNPGDKIETGEDGRIEISFDNGHIMELRGNTQMIIKVLSRDGKTGVYENLFECKFGKIRAKLQKIKGKSSFQVKTPQAICGVRGTIMYLVISPAMTKAFFEGGEGYLASLVSHVKKIIGEGMTSHVYSDGKIGDVTFTSAEERGEFQSDWGSDTGSGDEYGYSNPDGPPGGEESGPGGPGRPRGPGNTGGPDPFDKIKPKPNTGGDAPKPPPVTFSGIWGSSTGDGGGKALASSLYYNDNGCLRRAGEEYGIMASTAPNWWARPINYLAAGEYNMDYSADSCIWNTPVYSYNVLNNSYMTMDGGAYYGYSIGLWNNGEMNGFTIGLYIDPSGNIGYFGGEVTGIYNPNTSRWIAEGRILTRIMLENSGIPPAYFYESVTWSEGRGKLSGTFEGTGSIEGEDRFRTASLVHYGDGVSYDWGVYSQMLWGSFTNPDGKTAFSAVMGGHDAIGSYNATILHRGRYNYSVNETDDGYYRYRYYGSNTYGYVKYVREEEGIDYYIYYYADGTYSGYDLAQGNEISGTWDPATTTLAEILAAPPDIQNAQLEYRYGDGIAQSDYGYWIANLKNTVIENGSFTADLCGLFLTYTRLGSLSGLILGNYDVETSFWQAVGAGEWEGTPLALSGLWGSQPGSIYYNNDGEVALAGQDNGLIGTVASPWDETPVPYTAMGMYGINQEASVYIWNTPVLSYNAIQNNNTTLDGGAFFGYTAGLWYDEVMNGSLIALCMAPDGTVGFLTGNVDGVYYPGIDMWHAGGTLRMIPMGQRTDISPEDFYNTVVVNNFGNAYMIGHFNGVVDGGEITGQNSFGYTYTIDENNAWGIFDIKFGSSEDNTYSNPEMVNSWSSVIADQGDGTYRIIDINSSWENGRMEGDISGVGLSFRSLVRLKGDFYGAYDEVSPGIGTWIGTGIGTYDKQPLTISGIWGQDPLSPSLFYNDNGSLGWAGELYGPIGGIMSPWDTIPSASEFVAMGPYAFQEGADSYASYLWNTRVQSYNVILDNNTTLDGGAFYGYTTGYWNNGMTAGAIAAMCISPTGQIELLWGNMSGKYYPDVNLWRAEGLWSATLEGDGASYGITPDNFVNSVVREPRINCDMYGSFNGDGVIEGGSTGYSYFIDNGTTMLPWGVFDFDFGSANTYVDKPGNVTAWSAVMGGSDDGGDLNFFIGNLTNGIWDENQISADLNGWHLTDETVRTFKGGLFGIENGVLDPGDQQYDGSWVAGSVGTSKIEDLTFTCLWGEQEEGSLYYDDDGDLTRGGHDFGLIGGVTSPWDAPSQYIAIGTFETDAGNGPYIWNTRVEGYNGPDSNQTTLDGGAVFGTTAGLGNQGVMEGVVVTLYLAPDGTVGYIKGNANGFYYPGLDMFVAHGTLLATRMEQMPDIKPEEFAEQVKSHEIEDVHVIGNFGSDMGTGAIEGWSDSGYMYTLREDDAWGIFDVRFGDSNGYSNPDRANTWSVLDGTSDRWDYYQIIDIAGSWENGEIRGGITGTGISFTDLRAYQGDFYGIYTETLPDRGTWVGTGVGSYVDTPLTFSGVWGVGGEGEGESLYYNDDGDIVRGGSDFGLIGAVSSPWLAPADFVAIGEFEAYAGSTPYIWNTYIISYDGVEESPTTIDGGAFFGFTCGYWGGTDIEGSWVTLYVDPSGNVGYITGNVMGTYYTAIDMWMAQGTLTAVQMGSGIDPEDFEDYIIEEEMDDTHVIGHFDNGTGLIKGWNSFGYTYTLREDDAWGIFDIKFGDKNIYNNPNDGSCWSSAIAEGNNDYFEIINIGGTWENNKITGSINGKNISYRKLLTITGDFYGTYDEVSLGHGTWIGAGIGVYVEQPLAFVSKVDKVDGDLLSFIASEGFEFDEMGTLEGLLGGTESLFHPGTPTDLTFIGSYVLENGSRWAYLWGSEIQSYNAILDNNTTYDGGAFYGWAAGTKYNPFEGLTAILYVDAQGNAGIGLGDLFGYDYPDYNMFMMGGTMMTKQMAANTGISPDELIGHWLIDESDLEASGRGGFADGGSIIAPLMEGCAVNIEDYEWGIWVYLFGGRYQQVSSSDWFLSFTGIVENVDDWYGEGGGPVMDLPGAYMMGVAGGNEWSQGSLAGRVSAVWLGLNLDYDEGGSEVSVSVGTCSGEVIGNYQIEGEEWQAVGAGEWVEVSELFDINDLAELTDELIRAGELVSLPISEVMSLSNVVGSGAFAAGGNMAAQMDIALLAASPAATQGLWASLINGVYDGAIGNDWALDFAVNDDIIQLDGLVWSGNEWVADVSGTVGGNALDGTAVGTYTDPDENGDGTFTGIGAGTWENTPQD